MFFQWICGARDFAAASSSPSCFRSLLPSPADLREPVLLFFLDVMADVLDQTVTFAVNRSSDGSIPASSDSIHTTHDVLDALQHVIAVPGRLARRGIEEGLST